MAKLVAHGDLTLMDLETKCYAFAAKEGAIGTAAYAAEAEKCTMMQLKFKIDSELVTCEEAAEKITFATSGIIAKAKGVC